jgi:hypothetical protein
MAVFAPKPLWGALDAAIGFELDAVLCGAVKFDPSKSRRCATDQVAPLHSRGHLRHEGHEIFFGILCGTWGECVMQVRHFGLGVEKSSQEKYFKGFN